MATASSFTHRFDALGSVPTGETIPVALVPFLTAIKNNIDMLTGQRDGGHSAVLRGDITTDYPPTLAHTANGVNMDGGGPFGYVPTLAEYIVLANEVTRLQDTVNYLLRNMK